MSTHQHSPSDLEARLWKEIDKARFGMLGLVGGATPEPFQPMTAFAEPENGQIWFFTRTETDLARAIKATDRPAMFIVQAKDQGFQACINGRISQQLDRARMDAFWNPVVAAWFPDGKDDPRLTLLRLDVTDAEVWLSETNPLAFAVKIAKANATHRPPNLGESATLDLHGGG